MNKPSRDELAIFDLGDRALTVQFAEEISPETNDRVYRLAEDITATELEGVEELVPAYSSLTVYYDPEKTRRNVLASSIAELLQKEYEEESTSYEEEASSNPLIYELPVVYGGEFGPDLEYVASHAGMTPGEVVRIHSERIYRIYMLGFSPGFPYLGGIDERIACPRRGTPRVRVPAGSVGIAESQTGVYPNDSPGGWQLIGLTPTCMFNPTACPPVAVMPGGFVRFKPIREKDYREIVSDNASLTSSYIHVTSGDQSELKNE